ncbi:flagellar hook-associated protein FlgL [Pseudomonas eucalypticola]|uniref:Flagellar hook-associated protein FlgL n=1 Tax=Pseudomonas eucalypticola TaxID=2599595 RepID=A0A7D5DA49_9PSED|nr:flagellar hook-associated protein FlgL [Pseudomonas eucalypticola]QKZ07319.1 flagellar hook-associated protein FlgL [Pseudomonas eucalypticola]
MRISTQTVYSQGLSNMLTQEAAYLDASSEVSSGKRVVNPSDDSSAAAQAVVVQQASSLNDQYAASRTSVTTSLSTEESALDSISDAITSAKTLLIQAGDGTLSDDDRASIATSLQGIYDTLVSLANTTDSNGNYIFSGYQSESQTFVADADGNLTYQGDDNAVMQQISATETIASGDTGQSVFLSVGSAAGFVAQASADNSGSVTFDGPDITDSSATNYGTAFTLTFAVDDDGATTYSVDGGDAVAYESGDTVEVNGLSMTLEGEPADGDSISVSAAADADPDLFSTLQNIITALNTPVEDEADQAALSNTLSTSSRELDNALDNVLTVRTSVGTRMNEIDVLDTVGDDMSLTYATSLSNLTDADYTTSVSNYTALQVALQAAQQTFASVQDMTLFDYI